MDRHIPTNKEIKIDIRVRHLRGNTRFLDMEECPLALAIKEQVVVDPQKWFKTMLFNVSMNDQLWWIDGGYTREDYERDQKLIVRKHNNTIIRTLTLKWMNL